MRGRRPLAPLPLAREGGGPGHRRRSPGGRRPRALPPFARGRSAPGAASARPWGGAPSVDGCECGPHGVLSIYLVRVFLYGPGCNMFLGFFEISVSSGYSVNRGVEPNKPILFRLVRTEDQICDRFFQFRVIRFSSRVFRFGFRSSVNNAHPELRESRSFHPTRLIKNCLADFIQMPLRPRKKLNTSPTLPLDTS
jgi:hypothetical protein